MQALTVTPRRPGTVSVSNLAEPVRADGELLVDGVAIGLCGTDREIAAGLYGWTPPESPYLVIGHESLGRVRQAPPASSFAPGDLVVGVVRRPDPEPCGACARGEFDMCRNGRYRERGIKELHGYGSQRWTVEEEFAVALDPSLERVGVLVEPTSVVAKAWEQVDLIGGRSWFEPKRVLVTGAGPIGLLAALIGVQRGLDTHVLDRVSDGPKPRLVRSLGATYHNRDIASVARELQPDIVIEATGAAPVVSAVLRNTTAYGITCLTGVSSHGRRLSVDIGAVNREIVLDNDVVVGSVNAGLRHYRQATEILAKADRCWLSAMITKRVGIDRVCEAFRPHPEDVKVVVDLEDGLG